MEKDPKKFLVQKLNEFTDKFLSELEKTSNRKARKAFFRNVLLMFLSDYSCFAKGEAYVKCEELKNHFSSSVNGHHPNVLLGLAVLELMLHMFDVMGVVDDRESIVWIIIHRLICLYVAFAESDEAGAFICHNLGKERSKEWKKSTPMIITSNILEKREKNAKLPFNFRESLGKYSFGVQNI